MYRKKVLHLLLVLSDGTRSQIPASWTDFHQDANASSQSSAPTRAAAIGSAANVLRLQMLVDILLNRCDCLASENKQEKEEKENAPNAALARRTGSRKAGKDLEPDRLRRSKPTDGIARPSDLQSSTNPEQPN